MKSPNPEDAVLEPVQLYPLGDAALVLQFGHAINLATHHRIQAVAAFLQQQPFAGLRELVPAFTTLTVHYDPWTLSQGGEQSPYDSAVEQVQALLAQLPPAAAPPTPTVVELPVCYSSPYSPDLAAVARHTGLTAEEIVALHTAPVYPVYMIGFVPGFPYLGGLDARLATPRHDTPRAQVPAGSVGIAGAQTGVYPLATPGGWQLIGRTPLRLFDPTRATPSLLQAGNQVRFRAITPHEFEQLLGDEH